MLKDKVTYLIRNYNVTVRTYLRLLIGSHLTSGSHYVLTHTHTDKGNVYILAFLQNWSIYLNRAFVCIHAMMLITIGGLIAFQATVRDKQLLLVLYGFAALLILPAGLTYWQGDRYVLLAVPLWLVSHSALVGLFLDCLKSYSEAKLLARVHHKSPTQR
jgi:hypothetical protein